MASHYKEKRFLFTKTLNKYSEMDYFLCLNRSGKLWINMYAVSPEEGRNPNDSSHYGAYKSFEITEDMVEALADSLVLMQAFYTKKVKTIL